MKSKYWHRLYIEFDLRNYLRYRHIGLYCASYCFSCLEYKNAFFLEYPNDCKCDIDFIQQFYKKGDINWTFHILNVAYILNTIAYIVNIVCYILQLNNSSNEIRNI